MRFKQKMITFQKINIIKKTNVLFCYKNLYPIRNLKNLSKKCYTKTT